MSDAKASQLEERIIEAMRTVHDPEIPVNIYDLGLIYELAVGDGDDVHVRMTLTAPNCPVADMIVTNVKNAVEGVAGVGAVTIELVWQPPWTTEMMTEIAQLELEAMGIDPRRAKADVGKRPTGLTIGRKRVE